MNSNLLGLTKVEFSNTMKSLYLRVGLGLSILYVLLWLVRLPSSFGANQYLAQYFLVVKFVLILASANILGRDFRYGTYKYVFTGCFDVKDILISKIVSIIGIGFICWLVQLLLKVLILSAVNKQIDLKKIFNYELINSFVIYLVVAALIGSFAIFIASIFLKFNITFIFTLFIFGIIQFYAPIFILSYEKVEILPFWFQFVKISPVYIIFYWIETFKIQTIQLILMLLYSIWGLGASAVILNKRNLNY